VLSDEHVGEGKQLQEDISEFKREFKAVIEEIWKEEQAGGGSGGGGAAGQEAKRRPEKPVFGGGDWKVALFL
jgi:hypothetical protein